MANVIDQKVVEMKFDNAQFEKNVGQSMASIKNLNASLGQLALEKTTNNFDSLNKTVNNLQIEGLGSTLEALADRFSTLGIVGMTVIQNITNGLLNKLGSALNSVKNMIVQGGITRALNLENAQFQIEGLGYNWEKTLEDVNYAVDGTAYGLDAAAKAAGQLAAGGVKLGKDMKTALRGISGVAAMTNSSYDDIARIFENVAAMDRVYSNDIMSLSTRGINATAVLQKHFNKSNTQIKAMLKDGTINFAQFAEAMDDAFGEHAKEANKTFTGALSNVKAALSRVGAAFASPSLEVLRKVFVALIPVINKIKGDMAEFATYTTGVFDKFADSIIKVLGNLATFDYKKIFDRIYKFIEILLSLIKTVSTLLAPILKAVYTLVIESGLLNKVLMSIHSIFVKLNEKMNDVSKYDTVVSNFKDTLLVFKDAITTIFRFLPRVFSAVKSAFSEVFPKQDTNNKLQLLNSLDYTLFKIGVKVRDWAKSVDRLLSTGAGMQQLKGTLVKIFTVIKNILTLNGKFNSFKDVIDGVKNGFSKFFELLAKGFKDAGETKLAQRLKDFASSLKDSLDPIEIATKLIQGFIKSCATLVEVLTPLATTIFAKIGSALKQVFGYIKDGIKANNSEASSLMSAGGLVATMYVVIDVLRDLEGIFYKLTQSTYKTSFITFLDTARGALINWQKDLKGNLLVKYAASLLILAMACKVLASLDSAALAETTTVVVGMITALTVAVNSFNSKSYALEKFGGSIGSFTRTIEENKHISNIGTAILKMAASILILAVAMKIISKIESKDMWRALIAIGLLMAGMTAVTFALSKMSVVELEQSLKGITSFAKSVLIMAIAVKLIGSMDPKDIRNGVLAIGALMGFALIYLEFMSCMNKSERKSASTAAKAFTEMASNMILMAIAIRIIGTMQPDQILNGVVALGAMMLLISAYLTTMSKLDGVQSKSSGRAAKAFTEMASNMILMAIAIRIVGTMKSDDIMQGVIALGAMMLLITAYFEVMSGLQSKTGNMDQVAKSLTMMSAGLLILAIAIRIIGSMEPDAIAGAIVALGVMMAMFEILIKSLESSTNVTTVATALVIFAAAVAILAPALLLLCSIPAPQLITGVLGIAAAIFLLVIAVNLLGPVSAELMSVATGMLVFSAACALLGVGLLLAGLGLQAIAAGIIAVVASLAGSIMTILGLIPGFILIIKQMFVGMLETAKVCAPLFFEVASLVVDGLIMLLIDKTGDIVVAFINLVDKVITALMEKAPKWADKALNLLIKLLDLLNAKMPTIVAKLVTLGINLIDGLAKGIEENKERIKTAVLNFAKAIWDLFCEFFGIHSPSTKMAEAGVNLLLGLIQGIKEKTKEVLNKMKELCVKLIGKVKDKIKEFKEKGSEIITSLKKGIEEKFSTVVDKIKSLVDDMKKKFEDKLQDFKDIGKNIMDGIKSGITTAKDKLIERLSEVADLLPETVKKLLGINSPSRVFAEIGGYMMAGLSKGISNNTKNTRSTMKEAIASVLSGVNTDMDMNPVITPVLDLSKVRSGAGVINGLFGTQSVAVGSNVGAISLSMSQNQNRTTNSDIVSAIGKLKQSIENNPTTVNNIDGITYSGSTDISDAIGILVNAAKVSERSS